MAMFHTTLQPEKGHPPPFITTSPVVFPLSVLLSNGGVIASATPSFGK